MLQNPKVFERQVGTKKVLDFEVFWVLDFQIRGAHSLYLKIKRSKKHFWKNQFITYLFKAHYLSGIVFDQNKHVDSFSTANL